MSHLQSVYGDVVNMSPQVYNEIFGVALNDSEKTFVDCVQWWAVAIDFDENMGRTRIHKGLVHIMCSVGTSRCEIRDLLYITAQTLSER